MLLRVMIHNAIWFDLASSPETNVINHCCLQLDESGVSFTTNESLDRGHTLDG